MVKIVVLPLKTSGKNSGHATLKSGSAQLATPLFVVLISSELSRIISTNIVLVLLWCGLAQLATPLFVVLISSELTHVISTNIVSVLLWCGLVQLATPLFVVLICVELSDVLFAVDSIPAVFGPIFFVFPEFHLDVFFSCGMLCAV